MKNQFAGEPEGLRQFRDHRWKAPDEENSDLPGLFSVIIFDLLIFKTNESTALTKIDPEDLDLTRRILVYRGLRPF